MDQDTAHGTWTDAQVNLRLGEGAGGGMERQGAGETGPVEQGAWGWGVGGGPITWGLNLG